MNTITHAILAIGLSEALMLNPVIALIGAIIPDLDYVIGIQHRTITHSLIFLLIATLITYKLKDKRAALALFIGMASHLMIDSITPMGVPLLYPLNNYYSFNLVTWNSVTANLGIILFAGLLILNKHNIHDYLFSLNKGQALKGVIVFSITWFGILFLFPVSECPHQVTTISYLDTLVGEMNVKVKGTICSEIELKTSKSDNTYQIFTLCDETGNITIWKGDWVLENNLSRGDIILLCGTYTRKFTQPEIYYVTKVIK